MVRLLEKVITIISFDFKNAVSTLEDDPISPARNSAEIIFIFGRSNFISRRKLNVPLIEVLSSHDPFNLPLNVHLVIAFQDLILVSLKRILNRVQDSIDSIVKVSEPDDYIIGRLRGVRLLREMRSVFGRRLIGLLLSLNLERLNGD